MRHLSAAIRSTRFSAVLAAAVIVIATLLPGLHALQISHACGSSSACIDHQHASHTCCGHHHHDDEESADAASQDPAPSPSHDHQSCPVCKLIELMPAADPLCWTAPVICFGDAPIGHAWSLAAPVFGLMDGRWMPSRGPPRA